MTKDISEVLKAYLMPIKEQGIISNLEGLVRTLEYKPSGSDKSKKIPFPVNCVQPQDCTECDSLFICVPEKTKRCLVYFEGFDSLPEFHTSEATKYKSVISLICWYNLDFFQDDSSLQTKLVSLFSNTIKNVNFDRTELIPLEFCNPQVKKVVCSDNSIFNKYTYNENQSQFIGCRYSCFKIDFEINFTLYEDKNCIGNIVVIDNDNCC
jgi:hypothetical protein